MMARPTGDKAKANDALVAIAIAPATVRNAVATPPITEDMANDAPKRTMDIVASTALRATFASPLAAADKAPENENDRAVATAASAVVFMAVAVAVSLPIMLLAAVVADARMDAMDAMADARMAVNDATTDVLAAVADADNDAMAALALLVIFPQVIAARMDAISAATRARMVEKAPTTDALADVAMASMDAFADAADADMDVDADDTAARTRVQPPVVANDAVPDAVSAPRIAAIALDAAPDTKPYASRTPMIAYCSARFPMV